MAIDRIGFIGLGNLGSAIAERIQASNARLIVCDSNPERTEPFRSKGAGVAATPRDLAETADIIFCCLPTVEACVDVALGEDGVRHGKTIKVYVEISTVGIKAIEAVAAGMPPSIGFVDSPVSGGPPAGRTGTLSTMVAGKREHFDRAHEALSIIADKIFYVGDKPGVAQTAKLINNHLSTAGRLATFEALVMAMKAGLDLDQLIDIINVSSGQNYTTMTKIKSAILSGTFAYNARLAISLKDEILFLDEARDLGVPLWVAPRLHETNQAAADHGYLEKDSMYMIQFMGERAGIDVKDLIDKRNRENQGIADASSKKLS